MADRAQADYDVRLAASFAGVAFSVESAGHGGGHEVTTEKQFQRGVRVRHEAPALDRFSVQGYLTGPTARRDEGALRRALAVGPGTLRHPWYGTVQCIATAYDFDWIADQIEFVRVTMEFASTEIDVPEPGVGTLGLSLESAVESMATEGANFADEAGALLQFEELRPSLDAGTRAITDDAEYASAVAGRLLASSALATYGVPMGLQDLGQAMRSADAGDFTASDLFALEGRVLTLADRHDSVTLLLLLETAQLFIREAAYATIDDAQGENLQAIAVANDVDLDTVARNNRNAVARWFAWGEVRL